MCNIYKLIYMKYQILNHDQNSWVTYIYITMNKNQVSLELINWFLYMWSDIFSNSMYYKLFELKQIIKMYKYTYYKFYLIHLLTDKNQFVWFHIMPLGKYIHFEIRILFSYNV